MAKIQFDEAVIESSYTSETNGRTYVTILEPAGGGKANKFNFAVDKGIELPPIKYLTQVYAIQAILGGSIWGSGKDSKQTLNCADFRVTPVTAKLNGKAGTT